MKIEILKGGAESRQVITEEVDSNGLIEPFFSFDLMLRLYYQNTYHRRAIAMKASLLSNLEDGSKLEKVCKEGVTPKQLIKSFILNTEIFGNGFLELAHERVYNIRSVSVRVDKERKIYQLKNQRKIALEGAHLRYDSPNSDYYGEPDYLAAILAIATTNKIDQFNDAFFANNAKPNSAVIFKNSQPNQEQIDRLRDFYRVNFGGLQNAHKTLVLSVEGEQAGVEIIDLGKINDLSFERLKNMSRDEIIAAHGVPPRMMGIAEAGGLGGGGELAGQLHAFNELTIVPKQEEIEWFFDLIGYPIKLKPIDVSAYTDDATVVTQLVSAGIIGVPEARSIMRINSPK